MQRVIILCYLERRGRGSVQLCLWHMQVAMKECTRQRPERHSPSVKDGKYAIRYSEPTLNQFAVSCQPCRELDCGHIWKKMRSEGNLGVGHTYSRHWEVYQSCKWGGGTTATAIGSMIFMFSFWDRAKIVELCVACCRPGSPACCPKLYIS